jgi:hypothetical protein
MHCLPNPRVPLRSSHRGLRCSAFGSSIGPPNLRQSKDLASAPASVFFPGEPPPWISTLVLLFFSPPCATSLSLPTSPRRRDPHPCVCARPAPARGAAARGGDVATPCRRGPAARPRPPRRRPSSSLPLRSPSSFPMAMKFQREEGEMKKTMTVS